MAFLQLISANPNFSYILKKNPASGMLIKPCRKGRLFAWYTDTQATGYGFHKMFNIYFRDSDTMVSYRDEEFEYMDVTRYNAPMFLINAFHEFLNHMKKVDDKDIIGYENILKINQIKCKPRNLHAFESHFQDYEFKFEEVTINNFRIDIKTNNTIRELINLGQVLAIFNTLLYDDLYITDDEIDKYLACLQIIDSPYYIRHLFKLYFLRTENLFNKYKKMIEKSDRAKLEFEFGSTLKQRMTTIRKHLDFRSHIVDIGCGTGDYVREYAPRLKNHLEYHAIDTNPECIEAVKRLCKRKGIENIATWSSVDEFTCPDNSDILMTEVIEHMTKDDAALLIKKVLGWPFRSIIITTPNKEFNYNYQLEEDDMRNEDHQFEITKDEFKNWIEENIKNKEIKIFDIGDKVNDLRPTLAAIITQSHNNK